MLEFAYRSIVMLHTKCMKIGDMVRSRRMMEFKKESDNNLYFINRLENVNSMTTKCLRLLSSLAPRRY